MRILILGGDGYLGWPTAMHFSARGDEVLVVDNFSKRRIEMEDGIEPLERIPTLHRRVALWKDVTGKDIEMRVGDLANHRFVYALLEQFQPDAIVHYAEQPSAPYSMQGRDQAVFTQTTNVVGTLNLLFGMKKFCPNAHLVKLGTMGEYGTPNIDIEEGYIEIEHKGRKDVLPFPKQPMSFYHLSKVHDSHNIMFCCKTWGLRATDLNQAVVYGIETDQTKLHPELRTSFHYDAIFGTVLNRFCVQAVMGIPLTVYGRGGQTRGILNIRDTLQCVELAVDNPANAGECRVFNQLTEVFSVMDIATRIQQSAKDLNIDVEISHIENPRVEKEEHYFNPIHTGLPELGLRPRLLSEELVEHMIEYIARVRENVNLDVIQPTIRWNH